METVKRWYRMAVGNKAYSACAVGLVLGVADLWDAAPVSQLIQPLVGEDHAARIMLVAPVVFGVVRWYRNSGISRSSMDEGHDSGEPF